MNITRQSEKSLLVAASATMLGLFGCPRTPNAPPIASLDGDKVVNAGESVTLDGSASADPEGEGLTYAWRQTAGTPVILSSAAEPIVTFTAPTVGTRIAFELGVSDGESESKAAANISVVVPDDSASVTELTQRSVTEDPAFLGQFPPNFGIPEAGAGLPASPDGSEHEFVEFEQRFKKARSPGAFEDELPAGQSRTVEVVTDGPSGLAVSARWIGTSEPLEVTLALGGTQLATAKTHTMGPNRGGAYANVATETGGLASATVKNTTSDSVRIRIVFIMHPAP